MSEERGEVSLSRREYDELRFKAEAAPSPAPAPSGKQYDDRGFKTMEGAGDTDLNKDGWTQKSEMDVFLEFRRKELEDADAMRDAQRRMAWFSLFGMLVYPFAVITASFFGLDQAQKTLGDMAPTYFVAVAGIVAAFFGAQAFTKGK